ncbi:polysaccharide deacetylase family protein [Halobacterium bonnevillei]|uniref:Polysaccharide deacetylase family protein n=1 Tax=Halobacterium bonnevillei TaxID=2692200 RepID=A0A6B0SDV0_9EURY|nr:polysaccharide deacetylase family protein [Halobacterium bonnevillei]
MPATVTFSVEIELGWGVVQYGKLDVLSPNREAETSALKRLLDLCDEIEVPITFNVVGHLLRDTPLKSYDSGHKAGWFDDVPKTGPEKAPRFYAPDLINDIRDASVNHEICTHTFTHVECANVSPETLRWEFDKVMKTHENFGLDQPISLIPPRHSPPPRKILREYDIEIVRSSRVRAPGYNEATNRLQLALDILTGTQPITSPRVVDDIVETYCTQFPSLTAPFLRSGQADPHPVFRAIPQTVRRRLHSRNLTDVLSTAIRQDSYIHIWSHLWETANGVQWPLIEKFLRHVSKLRATNQLSIRTMEELNREAR